MAAVIGWALSQDVGLRIHCTPVDDMREHERSTECWCKPTQDDEEPRVWVHTSMDGREAFEAGERAPS